MIKRIVTISNIYSNANILFYLIALFFLTKIGNYIRIMVSLQLENFSKKPLIRKTNRQYMEQFFQILLF